MGSISIVKRVLVVDDHPLIREGMTTVLERHDDMRVCGCAGNTLSALRAARTLAPDLVVVDLSLGDESGLDLITRLLEEMPNLRILAISMHDEQLYAHRALRAGARGFVMKHQTTDVLLRAIRTVLAGHVYVSESLNDAILGSLSSRAAPSEAQHPLRDLSDRELQVYALIGKGHSTKAIATHLCLSQKTVETHRTRIRHKLGVDCAAALVASAAQWVYREEQRAGAESERRLADPLEDAPAPAPEPARN